MSDFFIIIYKYRYIYRFIVYKPYFFCFSQTTTTTKFQEINIEVISNRKL